MPGTALTLTLTQTKLFTGAAPRTERVAVENRVRPSAPSDLAPEAAFVLGVALGVDRERL